MGGIQPGNISNSPLSIATGLTTGKCITAFYISMSFSQVMRTFYYYENILLLFLATHLDCVSMSTVHLSTLCFGSAYALVDLLNILVWLYVAYVTCCIGKHFLLRKFQYMTATTHRHRHSQERHRHSQERHRRRHRHRHKLVSVL